MKTSELRIGNIISINGQEQKLSGYDIQFMDECNKMGIELPSCNSIKLTEDRLTSYGFKFVMEKGQDRIFSLNDFYLYWNKMNGYSLYVDGKLIGKPFYSVHALQNLYFSLTGNELA